MLSISVPELKTELHPFNQHRSEFLQQGPAKFALIKRASLIGMLSGLGLL